MTKSKSVLRREAIQKKANHGIVKIPLNENMSMKNGMLPCPFCARQPTSYKFPHNKNSSLWTVTCKCGAESPRDSINESGAKRIWNRRRYIPVSDR